MDRGRKFNSERADDFKKKSGLQGRAKRAHRRSLEWKQHRDDTVNRTRRIISSDLSPLQENEARPLNSSQPPKGIYKKDQASGKQQGTKSRQDMLRKWKDEKDLKKKIEAREQSKHKPFKVAHVAVEYVAFSKPMVDAAKVPVVGRRSTRNVQNALKVTIPKSPKVSRKMTASAAGKRVNDKAPNTAAPARSRSQGISQPKTAVVSSAVAPPTIAVTRRVTRSSAAAPAPSRTTKTKPTVTSNKPASTATKPPSRKVTPAETKPLATKPPTRNSARTKTAAPASKPPVRNAVKPVPSKPVAFTKPKGKIATKNESDKSTKKTKEDKKDVSFAPAAFKFEAPAHLQSFAFTPLSPSTAQQFLFGNSQIDSFSPISARRCSTPVHALSKTQTKVKHTPTQAPIEEATSASESDVESKPEPSPVKVIATKKSERRKSRRSIAVASTGSDEVKLAEQEAIAKPENVTTPQRRSRRSTVNTVIPTTDVVEETDEVFEHPEPKPTPKLNSSRRSTRKSILLTTQDLPTHTHLTEEGLENNLQPAEEVPHSSEEDGEIKSNRRRSTRITSILDKPEHHVSTPVPVTATSAQTKSEGDTPSCEPARFVRPSATMVMVDSGLGGSVFRTPGSILRSNGPKNPRSRTKSLCVSFSAASVSKKTPARVNRCSLLLRHVSPEEGVEVLKNSPMIDLDRRTPKTPKSEQKRKSAGGPIALPSFDDLEDLPALGSQINLEQVISKVQEAEVVKVAMAANNIMSPLTAHAVPMESEPSSEAILTTQLPEESSATTVDVAPVSELDLTIPPEPQEEEVHDVPYFRCCIVKESTMLDALCKEWEATNAQLSNVDDEVHAQIRTVVGKGQLLTGRKGRFTQFSTLVDDCEFKRGEKEVTTGDLQGFWDMVYFQVEDVYAMFGDLDKLKDNNWVIDKPKPKKIIKKKKPVASKPAAKPGIKARSGFAAFKNKLKQQEAESVAPSDPSTPAKTKPSEDTKTFEAGFFRVSSPVRSPAYHCEAGTPSKDLRRSCSKSPSRSNPGSRGASPLVRAVLEKSARKTASAGPSPLLLTVADAAPTAESPSKKRKSLHPTDIVSPGKRSRGKGDGTTPVSRNLVEAVMSPPREISVPVPVTPAANTTAASVFTPDSLEHVPRPRRSIRRSIAATLGTPDVDYSSRGRRRSLRRSVVLSEAIDTNQQANLSFSKYLMPSTSDDASASAPDDVELSAPSTFTFESPATDVPGSDAPRRLSASERRRVSHGRSSTSTPGMSSAAKWLSTGKKSCGRSVHFSVLSTPGSPSKHINAPLTPYNVNSLVPRERKVSGSKSATTSIPEVSKENMLLCTPPAATISSSRDNRPYTPSDETMVFTPENQMSNSQAYDTAEDDLMCFSPIATPRSTSRSSRTRRSMRTSLL